MENTELVRPPCHRENLSERFSCINEESGKQYAHIYFVRSKLLKCKLEEAAYKKWSNTTLIKKLADVKTGEKCCLIGVLFKHMDLQPSIVKEVSDELKFDVKEHISHYTSKTDRLILEDSCQRITLTGNMAPGDFYTGTMIAVLGEETASGHFNVEDFTFAGIPHQTHPRPVIANEELVMLVSGLSIGGSKENSIGIQVLIDYVLGMLGSDDDQEMCSHIVHVIIAGNSLSGETLDHQTQTKAKYLTYKTEAMSVHAMQDLDLFVSQLVPNVSVDIMPGEFDIAGHVLPQKPMHPCLFPSSRQYLKSTLRLVSNPYECKINGVHFLGSSGQNVNSLRQYSDVDDTLCLLSDTLHCQHMAPTAPDTLGCFPFSKSDPFVINDCPHVYFCANQEKFAEKLLQGADGQQTLLLSVPDFSNTGSAVLLNLKTLHAEELSVHCDWSEDALR